MCKNEITNFHSFKEKSARCELILLKEFNKPIRNKERKNITSESKPETATVATQTMTEQFTCMECKIVFKTEHFLNKHIAHKHTIKIDIGSQTDDIPDDRPIPDDSFVDELTEESIEMDYKREMKLEVLEVDDMEIEEMHIDMDDPDIDVDVDSEPKGDLQTEYAIVENIQNEYECNDCLQTFDQIEFRAHNCPNKIMLHTVNERSTTRDSDELSENFYEEVDLYECDRCHANFTNADDYTIHRNDDECEPIELLFKSENLKEKLDDDYHCSLCHKRFKAISAFNQHLKLHEAIEIVVDYLPCFPCDDCHKIFQLEQNILKHDCPKKKRNADDASLDESCTDYQYLEHDSNFVCDACSMEFSNLNTAKQHVVTHSKEFLCPFEGCGCTYEIWSRFAMHLGTKHLNAKRNQCKFCDVECESFDSLQAHYKNDCPEKKFKCEHCGTN